MLKKSVAPPASNPWRILIVDDEEDIHKVTKLALRRFELDDRPLEFLSAHDSIQARDVLSREDGLAVVFLDVVMETDDAGLRLAQWIREELGNSLIRIILRTGQPGQAPEEEVIKRYDINDYKQKTELDRTKLFTTIYNALRAFRDLTRIEESRRYEEMFRKGLEQVIDSTTQLLEMRTIQQFFDGLLTQVISLLKTEEEGIFVTAPAGVGAILDKGQDYQIIAQCGTEDSEGIDERIRALLDRARLARQSLFVDDIYVAYFPSNTGERESLLYLKGLTDTSKINTDLLNIFSHSIGIAFDNLMLNREIISTQEELISRLGNAVESRSKESGNHIRRIAEFSCFLARKIGLDEMQCELLRQASPMHDVGKIATPDSILLKRGKLDAAEMRVMQQHTEVGYDILKGSERSILQAAAIIAKQHHEKFDGSGYPSGLSGNDIHVYARIIAVTDVFDALLHRRCYKDPWPLEDVIELMKREQGKHFDPVIVDALVDNVDEMVWINEQYTGNDMT